MTQEEKVQKIYDSEVGGDTTGIDAQLDAIIEELGLDEVDEETDEEDEDEAAG